MRKTLGRIALTLLVMIGTGIARSAAQETVAAPEPVEGKPAVVAIAPPSPRPAPKTPQKGTFPFVQWSYAKAYTFNFFQTQQAPLRVVESDGRWSPHINSEMLANDEIALRAAELVSATRGSVELTKCTFPRHAIVYFGTDDKPVASANVCFDCEAVLAWPDYPKPDDFNQARMAGKFEKALPLWRRLFERDLALPIDWRTGDTRSARAPSAAAGQTLTVKADTVWFQDLAMLKSWQSLKASGNPAALSTFEDTALAERGAWRFSNPLTVKVLRFDPETKEVEVELQTPGRLEGTRWYLDAGEIDR